MFVVFIKETFLRIINQTSYYINTSLILTLCVFCFEKRYVAKIAMFAKLPFCLFTYIGFTSFLISKVIFYNAARGMLEMLIAYKMIYKQNKNPLRFGRGHFYKAFNVFCSSFTGMSDALVFQDWTGFPLGLD